MHSVSQLLSGDIQPFFQPILSLDNFRIVGYESLARLVTGEGVESLGSFFADPDIQDDEILSVDRVLRRKALERLAAHNPAIKLFLNLKPSWIYHYRDNPEDMPTLQYMDEFGVDGSNLVLELTEDEFDGDLETLRQVLRAYRKRGCQIAVDDLGIGFSNFDRIALLEPEYIKIDLNIVRKSRRFTSYRNLLQSFSSVAENIGASLLLEGIETEDDVELALAHGARYLQGFYFSPAVAQFLDPAAFVDPLSRLSDRYFSAQSHALNVAFDVGAHVWSIATRLREAGGADAWSDMEEMMRWVTSQLIDGCCRAYICAGDGTQLSHNYARTGDAWVVAPFRKGSNWIWRPYFLESIVAMNRHQQGIMSKLYRDIDTLKAVRTFSCPVAENSYLFVDLDVEQLDKQMNPR